MIGRSSLTQSLWEDSCPPNFGLAAPLSYILLEKVTSVQTEGTLCHYQMYLSCKESGNSEITMIFLSTSKLNNKYTVNDLRLQANIASAVLTYTTFCYKHVTCIRKERKINTQCILCWGLNKERKKQTNKQTKTH